MVRGLRVGQYQPGDSASRLAELVALLEQLDSQKHSAVLSEKLGDLYAAQGKPSSAVACVSARRSSSIPRPQQRVRLLLTLAEKLLALDRAPEAYEDYQKLLQRVPGLPGSSSPSTGSSLPLAQKLDKKADAEKYEAEITRLSPPPPKPQTESTNPSPVTSKR